MKIFLFFIAVAALGLLQAALNPAPDFLLICAVTAALFLPMKAALAVSLFSGLLKDSFSANPPINTVLFVLWAFLILRLNRKISLDSNFRRMILVFTVSLLHNAASGIILLYLGRVIPPGIFLRIAALAPLYNTAAYTLLSKLAPPEKYL